MNKKCLFTIFFNSLILKPIENQKAKLSGGYNAFMITNPLLIYLGRTCDKPLILILLHHDRKYSRSLPEDLIKKLGMMSFSFRSK